MRTTLILLGLAALLAGCVSAEEQRALDEEKCRSYGFTQRNDAFAECLQRIDLNREADFRAQKAQMDRMWYRDRERVVVVRDRPPGAPGGPPPKP